jgi:oxygen-independent coproporphyrinogen III oxidase
MAGIYIHIPFCKQACHYCNFHFSTSMNNKDEMVTAIIKEIGMRKSYLGEARVDTIYFGGGTPSVLSSQELESIIAACYNQFQIAGGIEMTLEANPDDLTAQKTKELHSLGINRLSIGIQSFHENDIRWMNRSHNADQSFRSIEHSYNAGIDNFSIDLIFGSPTTSDEQWLNNLSLAHGFGIKHLSCYGLTVEEDTALHHFIKTKKIKPLSDISISQQFQLTIDALKSYGYDHYEISNHALPGYISQHNTNYWKRVPYLGIGPSAHSYNGVERSWNIANNVKYMSHIKENKLPCTNETLSSKDNYNEYIMTGLRTKWGCDINYIAKIGLEYKTHFIKENQIFVDNGDIICQGNNYILNSRAWVISDSIISDLFYT